MFRRKLAVFMLVTSTLAFGAATPASAMTLTLDGVANFSNPVDSEAGGYGHTSLFGYGLGAELGFMLGGGLGFDVGALYLQRKFTTSEPGSTDAFTQTQQGVEVPVILRYWLGNVVSAGVGGYYFKYTGDIANTDTPVGGTESSSTQSYAEAQQTQTDYGLVASIRIDFPIGLMTGLVFDGRYEYGLANNYTPGNVKFRDMTGIVGLRFGWMK